MKLNLPLVLAASALAVLLSSCSSPQVALRHAEPLASAHPTVPTADSELSYSYWNEQPAEAPLRVTIDLSDQTAYFYRGGNKVGQSRVATGKAGHTTPTGSFTIMEKVATKRSNLYGRIYDKHGNLVVSDADSRRHAVPAGGKFVGAPMPSWMRLTGYGIGMHVGKIPNPGSPASHGCVRMPNEMARVLFQHAQVGTEVTIVH